MYAAEGPDDIALRQEIEGSLAQRFAGIGSEIRVAVREGQVVLQGEVRLLEHSLRAEQATWKTPGVVDVDNELVVRPLVGDPDASLANKVRTIVKGDERFIDTNLQINVRAGVVYLRGLFRDPGDVLALKHQVASVPGVLEVKIEATLIAHRARIQVNHA